MCRSTLGLELGNPLDEIVDCGSAPDFSYKLLMPLRKLALQLFKTRVNGVEPFVHVVEPLFHVRPKLFLLVFQRINPYPQLA